MRKAEFSEFSENFLKNHLFFNFLLTSAQVCSGLLRFAQVCSGFFTLLFTALCAHRPAVRRRRNLSAAGKFHRCVGFRLCVNPFPPPFSSIPLAIRPASPIPYSSPRLPFPFALCVLCGTLNLGVVVSSLHIPAIFPSAPLRFPCESLPAYPFLTSVGKDGRG